MVLCTTKRFAGEIALHDQREVTVRSCSTKLFEFFYFPDRFMFRVLQIHKRDLNSTKFKFYLRLYHRNTLHTHVTKSGQWLSNQSELLSDYKIELQL